MAKVLIIDDERVILDHFRYLIHRIGHEALLASSGEEGCAILKSEPSVALIITDYRMPGDLQGTPLIRELRKLRPDVPLIVVSGYPNEEILRECEELGVSDYLSKPYELSFAASVIARLMGSSPGETK